MLIRQVFFKTISQFHNTKNPSGRLKELALFLLSPKESDASDITAKTRMKTLFYFEKKRNIETSQVEISVSSLVEPGFPDQAHHNLTILWRHKNHTNFLTMILPWSAWNHIWSRVWSAWKHIWSRVWSAWSHKLLFQTRVDVTCNPNKNFQKLRTASFKGWGQ